MNKCKGYDESRGCQHCAQKETGSHAPGYLPGCPLNDDSILRQETPAVFGGVTVWFPVTVKRGV